MQHDPGGKVKTALPAGWVGDAAFDGPNRERRLWLSRWWGNVTGRYVASIGLNPSTAVELFNDPTLTRDCGFAQKLDANGLYKLNIMDYRATDPKVLLQPGIMPCGPRNLGEILRICRLADTVILCWGAPHPKLQRYAEDVEEMLRVNRIKAWCYGHTKDGHPAHPLYLPNDTRIRPYYND